LVYYPPYHSKYNPIERCWSALERKWNGVLLNGLKVNGTRITQARICLGLESSDLQGR
jgi:transposase